MPTKPGEAGACFRTRPCACGRVWRPRRRFGFSAQPGDLTFSPAPSPFGLRLPRQPFRLRVRRQRKDRRGAYIDPRGYDAGKKITGKKRHVAVDTLGLLLHVIVHPADIQDRDGGMLVVSTLFGMSPFLKKLFADGGYQGPFKRLWPRRFGTSRSKSSNGRIAPKASRFSHGVGPSMARRSPRQRTLFDGASSLLRATAAGDWPRTLPTSPAMPCRSSVLPRSASCCENSAIHNQLSRSTLTK